MTGKNENSIWPYGKRFAVCLTHDVDRIKKTYQYLTNFVKTMNPSHLKSFISKREDPFWNFEQIMNIEKKYNVKSTFFFLNETKKLDLFHLRKWILSMGKYSFNDEKIAEIIKKLHINGWEVGLHGSYESYKNKNLLKREKMDLEDVLGDEVVGIRQHYINLDIPKTWKIQQEIGLKYDASFGYRNKIGFREKKYYPFYPFNDTFMVIPLVIMDIALFKIKETQKKTWESCEKLIDIVEKRGCLLTILWHQRFFCENEFQKYIEIYEKIINECKKRDAFFGRCMDIYEWWIKNERN